MVSCVSFFITILFVTLSFLVISHADFFNRRQYPTYSLDHMPDTSFSCRDKILGGYYADLETQCQMFHVCVKVAGVGVQDFRFLCPNGTTFDQENQICADWGDVDCEAATLYYSSDNFDLYRIGSGFESKPLPPASEDEQAFHLQIADLQVNNARFSNEHQVTRVNQKSEKTLNKDRDIFHGSSSSNFFNNRNGRNEDELYSNENLGAKQNFVPREEKPSKQLSRRPIVVASSSTTTTTTSTTLAPQPNYNSVKFKSREESTPNPFAFRKTPFKSLSTENYSKTTNNPSSTTVISDTQYTTALNNYKARQRGQKLLQTSSVERNSFSRKASKYRTNIEYDNNQSTPFDSQFTSSSTSNYFNRDSNKFNFNNSLLNNNQSPTTFKPNNEFLQNFISKKTIDKDLKKNISFNLTSAISGAPKKYNSYEFFTTKQPNIVNADYYTTISTPNLYESKYTSYNATTKKNYYDEGKYVPYNPTTIKPLFDNRQYQTTTKQPLDNRQTTLRQSFDFKQNPSDFDSFKSFPDSKLYYISTTSTQTPYFNQAQTSTPANYFQKNNQFSTQAPLNYNDQTTQKSLHDTQTYLTTQRNEGGKVYFNIVANTQQNSNFNSQKLDTLKNNNQFNNQEPAKNNQFNYQDSFKNNNQFNNQEPVKNNQFNYQDSFKNNNQFNNKFSQDALKTNQDTIKNTQNNQDTLKNNNQYNNQKIETQKQEQFNLQTNRRAEKNFKSLNFPNVDHGKLYSTTTNKPSQERSSYNHFNNTNLANDFYQNVYTTTLKPVVNNQRRIDSISRSSSQNTSSESQDESLKTAFATHFASTRNEFLQNIKSAYYGTTKKPHFFESKTFEDRFGSNAKSQNNIEVKPVEKKVNNQQPQSNSQQQSNLLKPINVAPKLPKNVKLTNRDNSSNYDYAYYDDDNHFAEYENIETEFTKTRKN